MRGADGALRVLLSALLVVVIMPTLAWAEGGSSSKASAPASASASASGSAPADSGSDASASSPSKAEGAAGDDADDAADDGDADDADDAGGADAAEDAADADAATAATAATAIAAPVGADSKGGGNKGATTASGKAAIPDDSDEDEEDADDEDDADDDEDDEDDEDSSYDDADDEEESEAEKKAKELAAKKQQEKLDALKAEYRSAVDAYQAALDRKAANKKSIARLEAKIAGAEKLLGESRKRLEIASVEMYKNAVEPGELIDALMSAESLGDTFTLFDDYQHLHSARTKQLEEARAEHSKLQGRLESLKGRRDALVKEVEKARELVEEAKEALRKAAHLDGAKYHQVQRNGVNCGATAFTVAVNIMLGKERYKNNEAVWSSKAFGSDSTVNLAEKGRKWLVDNKLDDELSFSYVKGDIFKAEDMRKQLEAGNMIVISSGPGSEWQRVDKADSQKGLYPGGHWIVFYGYSEGIFYANDSAVSAKKGAGCPYTTKQMQQWLDGRSYHFACALSRKE